MKRKLLSLTLSIALCLSLLSPAALAAEGGAPAAEPPGETACPENGMNAACARDQAPDPHAAFFNGRTNTLTDSGFTVEGGTLDTDYTLSDNTLTIKTGTSLTISTTGTDAITGQIVIAENVSADLKLDGVNISAQSGKSAIELSSGSSLTLTLSQNSENTLEVTTSRTGSNAPGIHVPQGTALTVLCAAAGDGSGHICGSSCAKLTIKGGASKTGHGGVGIGGITTTQAGGSTGQPCGTVLLLGGDITVTGGTRSSTKARDIGGGDGSGSGTGGAGGTVIILTNVKNSSGSLDIGGGSGGENVDNGAGIKPGTGSNTYEVYGSLTLPDDLTIPAGVTVNIPSGTTLTVPSGKKLTNYGSITGEGTLTGDGALTNTGTVNVTTNNFNNNTVVGAFNITGGSSGTAYTYAAGVLTVNDGADLTISMSGSSAAPTSDRIVIAQNATATITLNGVKISTGAATSALDLSSGSDLTLILAESSENSLQINSYDSTGTNAACIHVPNGAELHIKCSQAGDQHTCSESSCGKLSAKGDSKGAGIGGSQSESCGTVIIDGGVVTATGGANAAGIGGGDHGSGGDITINGGIVTAAAGNWGGAAGIGGAGEGGIGGKVTITGGTVTATGDGGAAGIGGGWHSAGGTVIITGGVVTASLVTSGGGNGAGIGGGAGADNGTFSTSIDGNTGNAVIFASSNLAGNEIGDDDDTSNWSGVIFRGTQGFVYGNVTLTDSFTIPSGYTLTIPNGAKLTIPEGVTITNNGTIDVADGGKIEPESRVSGSGAVRYTVTFDANGHGTAPAEILVLKGGFIAQPTAPTADGYTFGGWYKEAECNTPWNFTADPVMGAMTLYAKWTRNSTGGGSTDPSYTITVPGDIEGGSVTVRPTRAERGDTVTITVEPDEGYQLDKLTVTDRKGNALELTHKGEGKFTFKMPASKVEVAAVFAKIPEPVPQRHPFVDVAEGVWYDAAVQYVYDQGMMNGITPTTFAPEGTTTRAMIVTMLYRLEGSPAVSGDGVFTDVEAGAWYADGVRWAAANGVVNGVSPTQFAPNDPITRQQMAAILYRYANHKGYDVSQRADLSGYTDAAGVSAYAAEAMSWANAQNMIQGLPGNTLDPQGSATRAQVAAMMQRFCQEF